jgi:hypothetical protein
MHIEIAISPGEYCDRKSILEIKKARLSDPTKLANTDRELEDLILRGEKLEFNQEVKRLAQELKEVNARLWDIEDFKRRCEEEKNFGSDFIRAAREVYIYNDRRAQIKRRINILMNSDIIEEKSHKTVNTPL